MPLKHTNSVPLHFHAVKVQGKEMCVHRNSKLLDIKFLSVFVGLVFDTLLQSLAEYTLLASASDNKILIWNSPYNFISSLPVPSHLVIFQFFYFNSLLVSMIVTLWCAL